MAAAERTRDARDMVRSYDPSKAHTRIRCVPNPYRYRKVPIIRLRRS